MKSKTLNGNWHNADLYESYVGRWSRLVAAEFLKWLKQYEELIWLDVGCGTGALTGEVLNKMNPLKIIGIDSSGEHIKFIRENIADNRAVFYTASAEKIPVEDNSADVIVSGLVLNFIPNIESALKEFNRVVKKGGIVSAYVWDYSNKMEMIRYFWDAAASLFDDAEEQDEGVRFNYCSTDSLRRIFKKSGYRNVEVSSIDIPTAFMSFDDYWAPFLTGVGPAPGYCVSLSEQDRNRLKDKIFESLPIRENGSIHLIARANAVKAVK